MTTMLGIMRGAVNIGAVFSRLRRKVHSGVVDTDSTPDVKIITPRADLFSKHRSCKSHIPLFRLDVSNREDFFDMAAQYYIENEGGVTAFFSAEQVEPYVRHFGSVVVTASADIVAFSSKRCWFCLC